MFPVGPPPRTQWVPHPGPSRSPTRTNQDHSCLASRIQPIEANQLRHDEHTTQVAESERGLLCFSRRRRTKRASCSSVACLKRRSSTGRLETSRSALSCPSVSFHSFLLGVSGVTMGCVAMVTKADASISQVTTAMCWRTPAQGGAPGAAGGLSRRTPPPPPPPPSRPGGPLTSSAALEPPTPRGGPC